MQIIPYTIFNTSTGEIVQSGTTANLNNLPIPDGCEIWGDALAPETYIFVDGRPIKRTSARLKTQEELSAEINRERSRRVELGRDFSGIWLSGSDRDQTNMLGIKDTARDLKAAGIDDSVIPFKDGRNVEHLLTAQEFIDLHNAGKQFVQAIYQASWALKKMEPIPQDVGDDKYWP